MPMSDAQKLGIEASNNAKARLLVAHQDEFDAMQAEERVKLGLSRREGEEGALAR